jgi:hypothetical protein
LFDTPQVGSVTTLDPAESAANAIAAHPEAEPAHGDHERSA